MYTHSYTLLVAMQRHQMQSNEFKNQQLETARAVRTQGWLSCRQAEDAGWLRLPHTHTHTLTHTCTLISVTSNIVIAHMPQKFTSVYGSYERTSNFMFFLILSVVKCVDSCAVCCGKWFDIYLCCVYVHVYVCMYVCLYTYQVCASILVNTYLYACICKVMDMHKGMPV